MPASAPLLSLTRETILAGDFRRIASQAGQTALLPDDELAASITKTLACRPAGAGDDIWIFGYGSLIWNPAFDFTAQRVGRIRGWHRCFCLWSHLGRGSPERPGLTLGLERGGSCAGLAYRLPPKTSNTELGILWAREMISGAYVPRWVRVETASDAVMAITFTINRDHPRYAGRLDEPTIIATLRQGCGSIGRAADYVVRTAEALENLGIADSRLNRYKRAVLAADRL